MVDDAGVSDAAEPAGGRRTRFDRLSRQDLANLLIEAPDTPMHMAVLVIVKGTPRSAPGADIVAQARAFIEPRLGLLPELRQRLHHGAFLSGRPVWTDDMEFRIEHHIRGAAVAPPGGEKELMAATERLLERLLERSRPLWEVWVLTGLRGDRFALLLKVHHAVTDGLGMLRIARILFDSDIAAPHVDACTWTPSPPPSWARLTASEGADIARGVWGGAATLVHPIRTAAAAGATLTTIGSVAARTWRGRRASLCRPIAARRALAVLRMDLAAVKSVAHRWGATVNDVVLELAASGIASALLHRGQRVDGVVVRALLAVNPVPGGRLQRRNSAGAVVVSLPLAGGAAAGRLRQVSVESRRARRWQRSGTVERFIVLVTRTRMGRFLSRRQGAVEFAVSNLMGPASPIYFAGCEVEDAIPITPISGNVTIDLCALSYAGRFDITVLADAASWPDLDVAVKGMHAAWRELCSERLERPPDYRGGAEAAARPSPAYTSSMTVR